MNSETRIPWNRCWQRNNSDERITLDKIPEGCAILLAEPGMGKTFELEKEVEKITQTVNQSQILHRSLGTTGYTPLKDAIDQLLKNIGSDNDGYIFLDAWDESPEERDISGLLVNIFSGPSIALARISIRITCRTNRWLSGFNDQLKQLWSRQEGKEYGVYNLQPLEHSEVSIGAKAMSFNAHQITQFNGQIFHHNLGFLTEKPLTLLWLYDQFTQKSKLPKNVIEAYAYARIQLVQEPNRNRIEQDNTGHLSPEERLVFIGRLAVFSLFSGKNVFSTAEHATTPESITLSDLIKSNKPDVCQGNK